jgi:8-oxo-dGTP pyrophosphatase MutT (NUDIX family)
VNLHAGHRFIFDEVIRKHSRVIVFLATGVLKATGNNTLSYAEREKMIREVYPDLEIHELENHQSDHEWSLNLDRKIARAIPFGVKALLYCGREGFNKYYSGSISVNVLKAPEEILDSATDQRREAIFTPISERNASFRAGAISAANSRPPTAYQTVDVAILDKSGQILLAGKPTDPPHLWRFVGGFSEPSSPSLEHDALKEAREEAGLEVANPKYVGSLLTGDWRYRWEKDKIKTALFTVDYVFGAAVAGDDVSRVRWFNIKDVTLDMIVEGHRPLWEMLKRHLEDKSCRPAQSVV